MNNKRMKNKDEEYKGQQEQKCEESEKYRE